MKFDNYIPMLSSTEALVLELLLQSSSTEKYGLELVASSGNKLKRGTVYVTLNRMEDKGYIESRQEEPPSNTTALPRRLYRVTGYGQKAFEAWQMAHELGHMQTAYLGGAF